MLCISENDVIVVESHWPLSSFTSTRNTTPRYLPYLVLLVCFGVLWHFSVGRLCSAKTEVGMEY